AAKRIVRLNSDGSRDATFNTGTGFDDDVTACGLQSNGQIVCDGYFTTYSGAATGIIRLNSDGSRDVSFSAPYTQAYGIIPMADGRILTYGNGFIYRLTSNGASDTSFNPGTGPNGEVTDIVVQADGKIVFGGWSTSDYNGTTIGNMARLN